MAFYVSCRSTAPRCRQGASLPAAGGLVWVPGNDKLENMGDRLAAFLLENAAPSRRGIPSFRPRRVAARWDQQPIAGSDRLCNDPPDAETGPQAAPQNRAFLKSIKGVPAGIVTLPCKMTPMRVVYAMPVAIPVVWVVPTLFALSVVKFVTVARPCFS